MKKREKAYFLSFFNMSINYYTNIYCIITSDDNVYIQYVEINTYLLMKHTVQRSMYQYVHTSTWYS